MHFPSMCGYTSYALPMVRGGNYYGIRLYILTPKHALNRRNMAWAPRTILGVPILKVVILSHTQA